MTEALATIFPPNRITRDAEDLDHWGSDRTTAYRAAPSAVVFPETLDEVVALVRLANAEAFALVPSGGRTGLSGGAVAERGEVVVSFDRMNRILGFDPAERLARCQAGVVTGALQAFAEERGLFYPVDFAASGSSQIGGNIATNAGGIRVIRYGLTRDWIAGLTVVTGTGDVLRCNNGLVKNATGYDFRHLLIGSEGTLGLVVEADVRLANPPQPQRVMVLGCPAFDALMHVLGAFQQGVTLSAFEFFSDLALAKVRAARDLPPPLRDACPFYALLEFDESALDAANAAFERCLERGWVADGVLSQSDAQAVRLWALREGISESLAPHTPYKNDLSVRLSDMPKFLEAADALISQAYPEFEVCWYGHIGDGNLHLNILKPSGWSEPEFLAHCHRVSPELFKLVAEHSGSISAEHGVGLLKREFLGYSRSPEELALMRGLKRTFDPNGVMNPGKLIP